LPQLAALLELIAPPAVISAFGQRPPWLIEEAPADKGMVAALRLIVVPGESEAITLACESASDSSWMTAQPAQRLGIPVTGTVGLLRKAKQPAASPPGCRCRMRSTSISFASALLCA